MNGDLVWIKYYNESGHTLRGNCIIGVTDGGINSYLVVGSDSTPEDTDIYLLMIKENGDIIKKMAIGDADRNEDGESVIAVGSTYYVVGTSDSHSSSFDKKAYVLRVNDDLNKIWDYTYGGDISVVGSSIINIGDSLVIAGYTTAPRDPYLARISWNGDLIQQYIKNATDYQEIYSVVSASDGDYVIAGTEYYSSTPPDMYLAKIDSSVLDPTPTPTPSPSSAPTATPVASGNPTAAPTEEPGTGPELTDEPEAGPTSHPVTEPTLVQTSGADASATPVPGTGETVTPAATPTAQTSPASSGDFSTSSVIIIILLTVIATALVGIGIWLFTQKKK